MCIKYLNMSQAQALSINQTLNKSLERQQLSCQLTYEQQAAGAAAAAAAAGAVEKVERRKNILPPHQEKRLLHRNWEWVTGPPAD